LFYELYFDSEELEALLVQVEQRGGLMDFILSSLTNFPDHNNIPWQCCALFIGLVKTGLYQFLQLARMEAKFDLIKRFLDCLVKCTASGEAVSAALGAVGNVIVGNPPLKHKLVDHGGIDIAMRAAEKWPRFEPAVAAFSRLLLNLTGNDLLCNAVLAAGMHCNFQ
jgi:hypothetical protein